MQYFMNKKRNLDKLGSFNKQVGVSSLLFIVLVGLSLTVLTVGYMSSIRSLQSSATTTHAQTQAQMQAMIGYHTFTEYLNKLSKEDNGLQKIDQVCNGEIKETGKSAQIIFERVGTCNNHSIGDQYTFDIKGKSGGASAILRANFNIVDEDKVSSHEGSIFAGGLKVQSKETLQALTENVSISVGAYGDISAGKVYLSDGKTEVTYDTVKDNIQVNRFDGELNLLGVNELKKHANYIFTHNSSGVVTCTKQNLEHVSGSFVCPKKEGNINQGLYFDTQGNANHWVVDVKKLIDSGFKFRGILWFDGDVKVKLPDSTTNTAYYFKNTILSTGNLSIEKDANNSSGKLNMFSPYDYIVATDVTAQILAIDKQINSGKNQEGQVLTESQIQALKINKEALLPVRLSTIKVRLKEICPVYTPSVEYPTNLCKGGFTEQQVNDISDYKEILAKDNIFLNDISIYPTSLFNLIGMADFGFVVYADENTKTNLYGNLIGAKASGNTGNASGKFAGTGQIEVLGNLVVADDMDLTEMKGNVKIKLGQTKSNGNFIPIKNKSFTAKGIRYM